MLVINVDTIVDIIDAPDTSSYAALMADNGDDGFISLREAVMVANNDATVDLVQLGAGVYTLELDSDPDVDEDVGDAVNTEGDVDLDPGTNTSLCIAWC